ncbi:hypothetical protein KPH14_006421 [Odynerus spinipes]|uniref:Uncharacterized protein n=1 Tax=Odynerus spinipes TaxID=1348599 RepID=A0AAD9VL98_9HYME|nr:hypothetical protein KPH14_006421 [Odynerus spinipes]
MEDIKLPNEISILSKKNSSPARKPRGRPQVPFDEASYSTTETKSGRSGQYGITDCSPDMLPSYYSLKSTEKLLLPSCISTSDIHAEVSYEEIMKKTVQSIIKITEIDAPRPVTLICKWGFDGSSGHSMYKQKFNQH